MPPEVQMAIQRINEGNPQPGDQEIAQQWLFGGASPQVQPMQGDRGPTEADDIRLRRGGGIDTATTGPAREKEVPEPQRGVDTETLQRLMGRLNQRLRAVEQGGQVTELPETQIQGEVPQKTDMSFSLREAQGEERRGPEDPGLGGVPEEVRQTLLRAGVPEQVANDRAFQVAQLETEGVVFDAKTFVRAIERGASPRQAFFEGMGSADRFGDRERAEDAIMENLGFMQAADTMVPEQGAHARKTRQRAQGERLGGRLSQLKDRVGARRAMRSGAPISSGESGPRSEGRAPGNEE